MTAAAIAMEPEPEFLRRREAAKLARVSVFKIDEWIKQYSDFPVVKLGKRTVLIPRRLFIEWLANQTRLGPPTSIRRRKR